MGKNSSAASIYAISLVYVLCFVIVSNLVSPSDCLRNQELLQTFSSVETTPSAVFDTTVGENRLVVDGHAVDMDGPVLHTISTTLPVILL